MNEIIKRMPEYKAILAHYKDDVAKRSGVKLISHIDEGLEILDIIGASKDAMRAFCIHPLLREDGDLQSLSSEDILFSFSPRVVLLAMEYRSRANDWLSDKVSKSKAMTRKDGLDVLCYNINGSPNAGVLKEVKQMLIADKVQNYKDFEKYHLGKHHRSEELKTYFIEWLVALNVTRSEYDKLVAQITNLQ